MMAKEKPLQVECGFQDVDCDYRGKNAVCELDEQEGNAVCPAGE